MDDDKKEIVVEQPNLAVEQQAEQIHREPLNTLVDGNLYFATLQKAKQEGLTIHKAIEQLLIQYTAVEEPIALPIAESPAPSPPEQPPLHTRPARQHTPHYYDWQSRSRSVTPIWRKTVIGVLIAIVVGVALYFFYRALRPYLQGKGPLPKVEPTPIAPPSPPVALPVEDIDLDSISFNFKA